MKTNIGSPRGLGLSALVFLTGRSKKNQQEKNHQVETNIAQLEVITEKTNIRDRLPTIAIVGLMALSACVSAQEKAATDAKLKQLRAEVEARVAREREERKHRNLNTEAMANWMTTYHAYLLNLCRTPSGAEHTYAWEHYQIAVSSDEFHAGDAAEIGRLVSCSALEENDPPKDKTSGYIWSNRPAKLSGFTWSNAYQERRHA